MPATEMYFVRASCHICVSKKRTAKSTKENSTYLLSGAYFIYSINNCVVLRGFCPSTFFDFLVIYWINILEPHTQTELLVVFNIHTQDYEENEITDITTISVVNKRFKYQFVYCFFSFCLSRCFPWLSAPFV